MAIFMKFVSLEVTNENEWGNFCVPTNFPKPLLLLNRQQLSLNRMLRLMLGLKVMSYEDS